MPLAGLGVPMRPWLRQKNDGRGRFCKCPMGKGPVFKATTASPFTLSVGAVQV